MIILQFDFSVLTMRVLVSRVSKAEVLVNSEVVASIGKGFAVFAGIEKSDTQDILEEMAQKVTNLRIFEDDYGKMNYSVKDKGYQILCVSNFTLCANTQKGRRPSFENSMAKDLADKYFNDFVALLRSRNLEVKTGSFGEHMDISLTMDGPVNIVL